MSAKQSTQTALAERLGVSRSYVNDVLRGRKSMPVSWLETYAEEMGLPLWEAIDDWAAKHEMVPMVRHDKQSRQLMARLAAGLELPYEIWEALKGVMT